MGGIGGIFLHPVGTRLGPQGRRYDTILQQIAFFRGFTGAGGSRFVFSILGPVELGIGFVQGTVRDGWNTDEALPLDGESRLSWEPNIKLIDDFLIINEIET